VNGLTELFLTKLDVLSGFDAIKVCTAYRADGESFDDFPPHQSLFHRAEPVWEELAGWSEELGDARSFADLPAEARAYVARLHELVGVPIPMVSVGPAREQSLAAA
jgi:adenylosuccinate synthase